MYKLDYSSKDPIYQQIVNQTKIFISKGFFLEGDQMPSVRDLAKTLLVNQSTITRAYKELEAQGIIQTVIGKGTFIGLDKDKIKWEKDKMYEKLKDLSHQCKFLGITLKEVVEIFKEEGEGEK